jgi:hypothetical protein
MVEEERRELARENAELREELRAQLEWRARATEWMAGAAPKREAKAAAVAAARAKRLDLAEREGVAAKRAALLRRLTELEEERAALHRRFAVMENARGAAELALRQEGYEHGLTAQRAAALDKVFRLHLERLATLRLREESFAAAAAAASAQPTAAAAAAAAEPGPTPAEVEETVAMWLRVAEKAHGDSRVAALAAVAQESADWSERAAAERVGREGQLRDALRAEHARAEGLRGAAAQHAADMAKLERALALEQGVNESMEKLQDQRQQEAQLLGAKLLRAEAAGERARSVMRGLTDELQDYITLVRAEVKKKFGYLPHTLLHAPVLHVPVAF